MIVVLAGYSSVGKDTVASKLANNGYNFVVSTVTRSMRKGESEGNPYYFTDNESFEKLIRDNELIEYRAYLPDVEEENVVWYYGVERSQIHNDKNYVVVLETVGLQEFKEQFGEDVVSIFLEVDEETRKHRYMGRDDFLESEWINRLEDDKKRFPQSIIDSEMDYIVPSYEVNETVNNIMKILEERNQ